MTIQELINELQEAIEKGYNPDTRICVDTMDGDSHWGISLDTDSSEYPDKDQWKIAINVWPYTYEAQDKLEDMMAKSLERAKKAIAMEESDDEETKG